MADEGRDIHGRRLLPKPVCIGCECRKGVGLAPAQQVHRWRRIIVECHGSKRYAAIADDDTRYPLTDLWHHIGIIDDNAVVMGMGVDEAGCERQMACVYFLFTRYGHRVFA